MFKNVLRYWPDAIVFNASHTDFFVKQKCCETESDAFELKYGKQLLSLYQPKGNKRCFLSSECVVEEGSVQYRPPWWIHRRLFLCGYVYCFQRFWAVFLMSCQLKVVCRLHTLFTFYCLILGIHNKSVAAGFQSKINNWGKANRYEAVAVPH